jgi:hypothetical protein
VTFQHGENGMNSDECIVNTILQSEK